MRKPPPTSLIGDLAHALARAERCVTRQLARALEAEDATVEQWRVLLLLSDGGGHPMSEIAEFALVPAPSLTRIIDRMVTDGLLYRTADPRDRRRVLVRITRRGRALHRRLVERIEGEENAVLAGGESADAIRLLSLLGGLVERSR